MILTIGHTDFIVPDAVNAVKLYETLAKLRPCTDRSYLREGAVITVGTAMVNLDLKSIPARAKLVTVKADKQDDDEAALDAAMDGLRTRDDGQDIPV